MEVEMHKELDHAPPSPSLLVLDSKIYSHVISPPLRPHVCDYCLSRSQLWDHLPQTPLARCSKCKVPYYCGTSCQRTAWKEGGHKNECKFLARVSPRVPPTLIMLMLRTLARHGRDPDYREILPNGMSRGLEDLLMHKEDIEKSEKRMQAFTSFLPVVAACVGEKFSKSELWWTYCRLLINSTELTDSMGNSIGTALSLGLSAIDHACSPNCQVVFQGKKLEVRTVPGLEVGWEEARIDYLSMVLPRKERRERLKRQYYFSCECLQCVKEDAEDEELKAGAAVCPGCQDAVAVTRELCRCGEPVPSDVKVAGAFLEQMDNSLDAWMKMGETYHCKDWRMLELGEAAMAVSLETSEFRLFLEIGEQLLEAYREYWHPYSISLGLHLAKIAKAAIYIDQDVKGRDFLEEAINIFTLSLGKSSSLVSYCDALRQTIRT